MGANKYIFISVKYATKVIAVLGIIKKNRFVARTIKGYGGGLR